MFSEKWHKRFMEVAELVATWSKDPSTKTGLYPMDYYWLTKDVKLAA